MRTSLLIAIAILGLLAGALTAVLLIRGHGRHPTPPNEPVPVRTAPPENQVMLARAVRPRKTEMIAIPAGTVQIGNDDGSPDESPSFSFSSSDFFMDRTPVTVAQFAAFVKETGYKTDAERYGSGGVLNTSEGAWAAIDGANWRRPGGPGKPAAPADHPVTQISWYDACAFCNYYGARLPTEFEWERAARLGQTTDGHVFRAGDPVQQENHYLMNIWQGTFPLLNTGADGYRKTSPVGAFGAAPSGLTDMAGNVWEWTSSWYLPYGAASNNDSRGSGERVSRGGSFLCSPQFCEGYRASARNHTTPDTSLENIGFRCVVDSDRFTSLAGRLANSPFATRSKSF